MNYMLLILTALINCLYITVSKNARCFMIPASESGVSGEVDFYQNSEKDKVKIVVRVFGAKQIHGFHIHEKGTIDDNCLASGPHFNPTNTTHGGPGIIPRHVGDLGNLIAENRIIRHEYYDDTISLFGENSIIARTCVIHAKDDDLGKGGDQASKENGNSGLRIACGIVQDWNPIYSIIFGVCLLLIAGSLVVYYFYSLNKSESLSPKSN